MMSKRRSLHFCEKIRWASLELGMLLVVLVPHTVELETLRRGEAGAGHKTELMEKSLNQQGALSVPSFVRFFDP